MVWVFISFLRISGSFVVHGTWVSEKKIEPGLRVELNEGGTLRVGGSTRVYRLHWVPLSRAYDLENPFVSEEDLAITEEKEEENIENLSQVSEFMLWFKKKKSVMYVFYS